MTQYRVMYVSDMEGFHVSDVQQANAEAQQYSLEMNSGIAMYFETDRIPPIVIYVDGWPYYPAEPAKEYIASNDDDIPF